MKYRDLILKSRSYRRFDESKPVDRSLLTDLVDLGRLTPSGGNKQPLKYVISSDPGKNDTIFQCLAWAGSLPDWPGPSEGERPTGYIIILCDTEISKNAGVDHGIAAQSILLGAVDAGLGGCMFGAVRREALKKALNIPERYDVLLVLALGYPVEKVVLEELADGGDTKYYRDPDGTHHVPKRALSDCILEY